MLDTMTLTKAVGAFCATFLVLLVGKWVAEGIYHVESDGEQAYAIEVAEAGDGGDAAEEEVPFEEVFASADAAAGEKVWRQCSACHKLEDGANGTGPHLFGLVGRDIGAVGDFGYSDALAGMDGAWTPENLSGFIANPKDWAPGTKMTYAGLKDIEDRADLIAYIQQAGG